MCIYIDDKIQNLPLTDEEAALCYEYLYHVIYMLASKQKYFHKEEYYDEFAITLAGDVFYRLFLHPKLKGKMTSCLNYIKSILYGRKVAFEQKAYSQKYIDIEQIPSDNNNTPKSLTCIREHIDFSLNTNIDIYLKSISKTVKYYVYHNSPYRKQPLLIKNIYISCLLSVINSLVFTQNDLDGLRDKYVTQEAKTQYLYKSYKNNKNNCVIIYHLSSSYRPYITILVRQIFTLIGNDIKELCKENISIPEDVLMNISLMEVAGKEIYDD